MASNDTIYAVDIKFKHEGAGGGGGAGAAAIAAGAGAIAGEEYSALKSIKSLSESMGKIERVVTKPGAASMGGLLGGAGKTGLLGGAIAAGIGTIAGLGGAAIASESKEDAEELHRMIQSQFEAEQDIVDIRKEYQKIIEDGIITVTEYEKLQELSREVEKQRAELAQEINDMGARGLELTDEQVAAQGALLDMSHLLLQARMEYNKGTQSNIANINAETAAYDKQVNSLRALVKLKDEQGRSKADIYRDGKLLGEYTGQTYDVAQAKKLGYGSVMGAGSQGVFIGTKTVQRDSAGNRIN